MKEELENYWSKIYQHCDQDKQFLRREWFDAWSVYGDDDNNWSGGIHYGTISDDQEVAVLPYSFQKVGPFNFASVAGLFFPHRGIPNTGVSKALADKTVEYIENINDVSGFRMGPVEETDPFTNALINAFKGRNWKLIRSSVGYDYGLKVPTSEEEYLANISKKRRKKVAYYGRRLEKTGEVKIKNFGADTKNDWKTVFSDLAQVESNAWISKTGEPRFMGQSNQTFWIELANHQWFNNAMDIWIMYLDGVPVSHLVSIDTKEMRYAFASSYDEKVANFRTGSTLEIEMMKKATRSQINFVNNGLGNSGYKADWGSEQLSELIDIVAFPPTLKGRIAFMMAKLKMALGR